MLRILKKIIWWLFLLLVLASIAGAVYVWRSFPTLSGEQKLSASGLKDEVRITRDASDITHIHAKNVDDAAFALGYTHAQERSWQLDFNRRIMHGELSAMLGAATLETDKLMRSLGIIRAAQKQFDAMPADAKAQVKAYADGINAFYATSSQALPPEFHVLGVKPAAWTGVDSVGWAIMMALDLGGNWGTEFGRLSTAQKLPTKQVWDLFPAYPGDAPISKVDLSKLYADLGVFKAAEIKAAGQKFIENKALAGVNAAYDASKYIALTEDVAANIIGSEIGNIEGKGSNNWVVAGSHTVSGKPLLANDPHLGLSAPAIWYFAGMHVPGVYEAVGATLPGLPSVVLGRTAKVAWGFTNTGPDVQDLYLEQINPANPKQYKTPTGWADFETRTDTIKVKGQPDVSYSYRSTRHGPVISDAQAVHAAVLDTNKFVIALRWSALDADNTTVLAGINAQKAQSVDELIQAFSGYHSPMQNAVMADVSGKIAYKAIGKVPVRSADNDIKGAAPAPGWDAKYDWTGWLPYAQTPQDDGQKGWVVTANQRIHPKDYPHFITGDWVTPERFDRIEALMAATPKHDMASMHKIQADTTSLATQKLLPVIREVKSSHTLANNAQALLKKFNGNMDVYSAAPLIFSAWADELTRALVAPKLGEAKFKALYGKRQFRGVVEQTMLNNDATWCAPKTCAEQSSEAMTRALERLSIKYGKDMDDWHWGDAHVARSIHKPLGNVPLLAKWFDVTVPTPGDAWTVNVGQNWLNEAEPFHNRHAASLRSVFDLSDLEKSSFIYQTGQSGLVFSSRYNDMSKQWAGRALPINRPLQLNPTAVGAALVLKP